MHTDIPEDVIFEVLEYLRDPRFDHIPTWWTQFDSSLRPTANFLANLGLVGRPWLVPTRHLLLQTVCLPLNRRSSEAFFYLVGKRGWGHLVRRLIINFPISEDSQLDPSLRAICLQIVAACPKLRELHLDNVPSALASNTAFVFQVMRQGTFTTFGMRAVGPESAFHLPCTSLRVPSMARLRSLILCGVDLDADGGRHTGFRNLESLHLHVCSLSKDFITALGHAPLKHIYLGQMPIDMLALSRVVIGAGTVQSLQCDKVYAVVDDDVGGSWVPEELWDEMKELGIQVENGMRDLFPYWPGTFEFGPGK